MRISPLPFLLAATLLSSPALAQKAENEPQPAAAVPMITPEDVSKWAKAYQRAGRPKTLVLVGWESPLGPNKSVLEFLEPDAAGISERFRAALSRVLGQPEIRFREIDPMSTSEMRARLSGALSQRSERSGIDLLANTADAELVILLKLQGTRGSAPASIVFQPLDYSQGMRLRPLPPIDWAAKGFGVDDQTIVDNMHQVAKRFIDDYHRFVVVAAEGRDYTLRVFGLSSELLPLARRALKAMPSVDNFQDANVSIGTDDSMAEFEIGFRGSPGDFREAVQQTLTAISPGLAAVPFKGEGGTLNIRVKGGGPVAAPLATAPRDESCDRAIVVANSPQGLALRTELRTLYERRGSPRVAVLINRSPATTREVAATTNLATTSSTSGTGGDVIVVQNNQSAAPEGEGALFSSIRELDRTNLDLESRLYERLGTQLFNFRRADAAEVRAVVSRQASNVVLTGDDLLKSLREANVADIFIIGRGSVQPVGEGMFQTGWVFRVVQSDGRLLATASGLQGTIASSLGTGVIDSIADQALGRLMCEVLSEWREPASVRLEIRGEFSEADWQAISKGLASATPALGIRVVDQPTLVFGGPGARAEIMIEFACTPDQLRAEISRIAATLPFGLQLDGSSKVQLIYSIKR
jgi:hypothetical protein